MVKKPFPKKDTSTERPRFLLVLTSVDQKRAAQNIARRLTQEKLAACVHIAARGDSYYFWEGKYCQSQEYSLWIKTTQKSFKKLEKRLLEIHPYDCPEVLAIPVTHASQKYGAWLEENTRPAVKR